MTNQMYCGECGGELKYRIKGSVQGLFCEKCGYNVVTTYIPPIKRDLTIYQVFLLENYRPTIAQIKTIAKISNRNYLEARHMLLKSQVLIYEGRAELVFTVIKNLEKACLLYKVLPAFPYDLA